jgi:hypothetical protein
MSHAVIIDALRTLIGNLGSAFHHYTSFLGDF